jgi:hypothetical protein
MILGQWGAMGEFGQAVLIPSDQEKVLAVASTDFTVQGNGQYFGYKGRDNLSILKFTTKNFIGLDVNTNNMYFDFENNQVDKVVIEVGNTPYFITSDTSSITFSKENMIVRFGDLNIPHSYIGKINIILYVANDPDGILIADKTSRKQMMVNYQI